MVAQDDYHKLATSIAKDMDHAGHAYTTKTRLEIATLLRNVTNQPRGKIGRNVADAIEAALQEKGLRVFPHINDTGPNDAVRIIRSASMINDILNAFLHPSTTTDKKLADLINTAKGHDLLKWKAGAP